MSFLRSVVVRDRLPGHFAFKIPAVQHLEELQLHPVVTFLVGENAAGKSTLLEAMAMACGFPPEGGSKNMNCWDDEEEERSFSSCLKIIRGPRRERDGFFLRAESFFNVATLLERMENNDNFMQNNYGTNLHEVSHGESFLSLAQHRFRADSLFFFDEPEAALSPQRQLAFLLVMQELSRKRCQFVIATHSPILMSFPDSWLYEVTDQGFRRSNYQETEHFLITRDFLRDRQRFLRHLFEE